MNESILADKKIFIAGHLGMVGSALWRSLSKYNVITLDRSKLDLINQQEVESFFAEHRPNIVINCAAKVGGILANNSYRGEFIYNNLQITSNIIHFAQKYGADKLINLGSSCIYPKQCEIPIQEEALLSGKLEPTNEPYAIAKIAGIKLCESYYHQYGSNFYSLMPCNLYGFGDNFDLETSHVLPALMRKIHSAKENKEKSVEIWGSGKPLREFLFVDDLAEAIKFCLLNVDAESIYSQGVSHLNCGSDEEVSIMELVNLISEIVGYKGEFVFDSEKPDGTFRKKMDNKRIFDLGFEPAVYLKDGLRLTYNWFKDLNFN
jgi:GDP-L-fucose synthase